MAPILLSLVLVLAPNPLGPVVLESKLSYGLVRIFLPSELLPGMHVSGSVFATPSGRNWEEQHRNLEKLDSLILRIGGSSCKVADTVFEMDVPPGTDLNASIEDVKVGTIAELKEAIGVPWQGGSSTIIAEAGGPIGVAGDFDGSRSGTSASIDGLPVGVLAESAHECFVTAPAERQGPIQLTISGKNDRVDAKLNIVSLNFLAPAKPTVSGNRSSIGVEVSGLQGLVQSCYPVLVDLTIDRPEVARFEGPHPDTYRLEIWPQDVTGGNVLKSVPIEARQGGSYIVHANITAAGS